MLAYIYYRFDFQPIWFKALWRISDFARRLISRLPYRLKLVTTWLIAVLIYLPLARLSGLLEWLGADVTNFPLSYYRGRSVYTMKTDALDRFGTLLEHRFTQPEIRSMFEQAGFERIELTTIAAAAATKTPVIRRNAGIRKPSAGAPVVSRPR